MIMQKKEKKQLTKIQLEKKKEKGLLWCKILTAVSLSLSLLSLLFSCSANVNKVDQTNKNDNTILTERHNAVLVNNENESFIYEGNLGYKLKSGLTSYDINVFISYIDTYLGDNRDKSIYFIFDNGETHSIYNVVSIDSNNLGSFTSTYIYNDEGNIVYPQFVFNTQDYELGGFDIILKFNYEYDYTLSVSQYFIGLVNLYHYDNDTTSFYYTDFSLGLIGSFFLESNFVSQKYFIKGTLHYYDSDLNYITFDYDFFELNYTNGIQFYTTNDIVSPYGSLENNNKRRYSIYNYDADNYGNIVKVTNVVLSDVSINDLPTFLIRTDIRYTQNVYLGNLYYAQSRYIIAEDYARSYDINFISNNQRFDTFDVVYNVQLSGVTYWEYKVTYSNNINSINVLDVTGVPHVEGTVGSGNGADYTFNTKLNQYQNITIYDYFDVAIQSFQRNEKPQLTIKPSSPIADNGALGTALDVIVSVFTSFLPFLSFEIFPNFTIGVLLLIPFLITLMLFIFNMFKR